ncbi:hypothetical protein GQ44DRAFT_818027 [Phaeosphaeriaceae sp. PMI808]|nr:hypothetical protein GQ44DRAFT_818027 [Phaeosphaeriaceae sp. PMI808]
MSCLRTSLPIPTQPWEAARAKFLEALSEEESARFKNATLENLFYDASAAQKGHAQKSRSWLVQERLSSLVDSVADYGKALDVYSNTYGLIMSPIWGSLRVVLHIASEAGKFQEKIVEMFAQIGDLLPRFHIYQALFTNHERLLVALSVAYLDVLRFCVRTKDFFKRTKQSMVPLSIVLKGAWKPFRTSFEESISDFRKHSKLIEKEANLAHMIESARRHEVELANRALQLRNQKLDKRHRILSILPSVDYQSKLFRLSSQRHPGTARWIYNTPQFISWSASSISDCLCVYGIPGSGKSVLSASVVDTLRENTLADTTSLVCYYICDFTDIASLEPLRLLGSLIQQALQTLPLDRFDENFQCPFVEDQSWPAQSTCLEFLFELLKNFKTTWFILDAIDELAVEVQTIIFGMIDQLLRISSATVKIFVTSRVEDYLIRKTLKVHKILQITQGNIDKDISLYVEEQIKNMIVACNPLLENERLSQEVINALLNNADGM